MALFSIKKIRKYYINTSSLREVWENDYSTSVMDQVNSGSTKAQAIFDDAVLYPNPYMVVTSKGYTKHYYAGTERLATVIGG